MAEPKIDLSKYKTPSDFAKELPEMVRYMDAARAGNNNQVATEISLSEMIQGKFGLSQDDFFEKLGVNPRMTTMQNIFTMPDQNIPASKVL